MGCFATFCRDKEDRERRGGNKKALPISPLKRRRKLGIIFLKKTEKKVKKEKETSPVSVFLEISEENLGQEIVKRVSEEPTSSI